MKLHEKLQGISRQWVYLLVFLAMVVPLIWSFNSKTYTTEPVENIYQLIDSYADREDRAILLDFYHDASTMPELYPMELSIIRHCFERNVKLFTICWSPSAAPLIEMAISSVREHYPNVKSGTDYCNLGYKPISLYMQFALGMGDDIGQTVGTDSEGRNVANLPIMKGIRNYNEMNLIIEFSGSDLGGSWITYARSRFGANVAVGVTAVMAAEAYPFLQTGQLIGFMGGLKGASEYEKLVDTFASYEDKDNPNGRSFSKEIAEQTIKDDTFKISDQSIYDFKMARIGMNAQTVVHLLIIFLIILGNVGYFLQKRDEKKHEGVN